ncbi:MAG: DUF1460 domain-containing protein [Bacteroidetes bacterium]|nr:DUF1460 domain-containing protein [Bacteroidota bacterium]
MERRTFLALLATPLLLPLAEPLLAQNVRSSRKRNTDKQATSRYIFSQAMRQARADGWHKLSVGEAMGQIGLLFVGTPYVGGTLEGEGMEQCRIDLTGLDCVTFFENTLDMARIVKKNKYSFEDLQKEVLYTRYRGGVLTDYTSRLHYTSEWISDNVAKGVVQDMTRELGGVIFVNTVNFMSTHPQYYAPLKQDETLQAKIGAIEERINATTRYFIPKDRIVNIESKLQTGDIIAIATSKEGLDYAHTGIIFKDDAGVAHLFHASSQKKKVVMDVSVSEYVNSVKSHTGITVVRPTNVA